MVYIYSSPDCNAALYEAADDASGVYLTCDVT